MKKRILIHILILISISFVIGLMFAVANWDTLTFGSLAIYFLQVASGIFLILVPPIYFNIYWLIPKYLVRKQYIRFGLTMSVVIIGWGSVIAYIEPWMDHYWFNQPKEEKNIESGILIMVFIMLITTLLNLSYKWFFQLSKINKIENDRLHLELSLLKNQINPHFFFNTLNNLYALSLEKSDETPSVILKLSEMMRYTIYDCKASKVSIAGEVTYLDNFIALQKMRHHKRGIITFKKEIENESIQIAPMILIVFLENAFKHGFDLIEKNAFLNFELKTTEKELYLCIENNFNDTISQNQSGIGLENVKRRLSLIYPNAHSLDIIKKDNEFIVELKLNLE
ncbi:sensor histidine kinase [Aquimarina algiphila]|uniref:sensor histidine kinase n=1 Tax=Aquimarina algiphila TaxID=2047982 RepID=UPI00232ACE2C|nr:sensor histidine kinase [Aquimarina algiphila]